MSGWLVEILPTNPNMTVREFVHTGLIERLWLEGDGSWNGMLRDGKCFAVHPNSVRDLDEDVPPVKDGQTRRRHDVG